VKIEAVVHPNDDRQVGGRGAWGATGPGLARACFATVSSCFDNDVGRYVMWVGHFDNNRKTIYGHGKA
jgi:hypothetical protein